MVEYCIMFVLGGESPRDQVDLLCSLKFLPSVNISDISHHLAAHDRSTIPDFLRPNNRGLYPITQLNIDRVTEGQLVLQ